MKFLKMLGNNSNVNINGKSYSGNNITVQNSVVFVDGVEQGDFGDDKKVVIKIMSNVDSIESKESITIQGSVKAGEIITGTSFNADNVIGNVKAGSSVNCDDIKGNVYAGTTINCDRISGNASANRINH